MDQSPGAAERMLRSLSELELRLLNIRRGFQILAEQPDFGEQQSDYERAAAFHSLSAVVDFLQNDKNWKGNQLDFSLTQVMVAIANLEQGKSSDLLKAAKRKGRPPTPLQCQVFQGRCAAVLEMLMRAKWKQRAASSIIFRHLKERRVAWIRGAGNTRASSESTIEDWRDEVQGDPANSPRGASYSLGLDELKATDAWGDKDKAKAEAQATLDRIMVAIGLLGGPPQNPRK